MRMRSISFIVLRSRNSRYRDKIETSGLNNCTAQLIEKRVAHAQLMLSDAVYSARSYFSICACALPSPFYCAAIYLETPVEGRGMCVKIGTSAVYLECALKNFTVRAQKLLLSSIALFFLRLC